MRSNERLIKSAHVWAVVVMLFGVIVFAGEAVSNPGGVAQEQNSNSNANANTSRNQNQNSNASTSNRNANNSNATGEQAGMSTMSSRDHKFIMEAAMGGMKEVELGRWAAQKGTSAEVKQFGQQMVQHHTQANTELMQMATSKGMTLPTALDEKHQKDMIKVTRLSGAEFDRAYSKMMLKDHEDAVSDFEKQSTNGDDADLKAFAAKALPTLQEHLQMARALPGNAGSGGSNSNSSNRNSNSNRNDNGNTNRP